MRRGRVHCEGAAGGMDERAVNGAQLYRLSEASAAETFLCSTSDYKDLAEGVPCLFRHCCITCVNTVRQQSA